MAQQQYALKTFVHRVLALRLLVAGLIVAAAFGAISYARGYERIADVVVLTAHNGIERIRIATRQLIETSTLDLPTALQRALDVDSEQRPDRRHGEFVYARFYDPRGGQLAERTRPVDADAATLRRSISELAQQFPAADGVWQETVDIAGHPHVHLVMPVLDRAGAIVAYAEGLFRVSGEAVAAVRYEALKTAGYVALIVLATALLLYPVILSLMRRLAHYSESLLASNLETLEVLGSAIAKRDSDTDAHNYRVTLYSLQLAEAMGLDAGKLRALAKGAFLHDVGKIGIRDHILHKPARLDAEEFRIMQTHVDHGLDIVQRSNWLADARDVVGGHHEKYDGSGYPKQTAGEAIPVEARVFAIADVFDALTSRRPYKAPLSFEETMEILEAGRGKHFDPALLDRFGAIARALYDRYSGRDDDALREEARAAVNRLFVGGLETLRY